MGCARPIDHTASVTGQNSAQANSDSRELLSGSISLPFLVHFFPRK